MKDFITLVMGAAIFAPTLLIFVGYDFGANLVGLAYATCLVVLSKTKTGAGFTARMYKSVLRINQKIFERF